MERIYHYIGWKALLTKQNLNNFIFEQRNLKSKRPILLCSPKLFTNAFWEEIKKYWTIFFTAKKVSKIIPAKRVFQPRIIPPKIAKCLKRIGLCHKKENFAEWLQKHNCQKLTLKKILTGVSKLIRQFKVIVLANQCTRSHIFLLFTCWVL